MHAAPRDAGWVWADAAPPFASAWALQSLPAAHRLHGWSLRAFAKQALPLVLPALPAPHVPGSRPRGDAVPRNVSTR